MISAIVYALLVTAAAATGGIYKPCDWYAQLNKPGWTPPNWAFPLVWLVLYLMIGAAGWITWRLSGLSLATGLWVLQLVLNAAWSWLFFGRRRMDLAIVDVIALWLAIAGFILAAWPVSPTASLLFVPYLAWVSVAATLNKRMLDLNPDAAPTRA